MENVEVLWLGKVVERELVGLRHRIGPCRADDEAVGVAGDLERRIFKGRGVAHELRQRVVEIALLLFVFPSEKAPLPDVGEAFAAAGLGDAFLEGERLTGGIGLDRIVVAEHRAQIEKMRLRGGALGERDRLPFLDELLWRHGLGSRAGRHGHKDE